METITRFWNCGELLARFMRQGMAVVLLFWNSLKWVFKLLKICDSGNGQPLTKQRVGQYAISASELRKLPISRKPKISISSPIDLQQRLKLVPSVLFPLHKEPWKRAPGGPFGIRVGEGNVTHLNNLIERKQQKIQSSQGHPLPTDPILNKSPTAHDILPRRRRMGKKQGRGDYINNRNIS